MAKTLQQILDPKLIPSILEKFQKPYNPEQQITRVLRELLAVNGYTSARFVNRGNAKFYIIMS